MDTTFRASMMRQLQDEQVPGGGQGAIPLRAGMQSSFLPQPCLHLIILHGKGCLPQLTQALLHQWETLPDWRCPLIYHPLFRSLCQHIPCFPSGEAAKQTARQDPSNQTIRISTVTVHGNGAATTAFLTRQRGQWPLQPGLAKVV